MVVTSTSVAARPAGHARTAIDPPRWTRGDIFRALLFGLVGVGYAVLLFPLAVLAALLWAAFKLVESVSSRPRGDRS